ncbi:MAG: hypothetical protein HQL36_08225 [Alphaproteobacteria bacterium]|nr:hypothetical protein [Alphaproteobacteria bacterium]
MSDVALTVDGLVYVFLGQAFGFQRIDGAALGLGQQARKAILPGQKGIVAVDGEVFITGYVDDVSPAYSGTSHDVTVDGRDATGDLVDCSAIHQPGEWQGLKLEAIAAILAKPFGIPVKALCDTGTPFRKFRIEEGETAFEAIERACRMRAVLPVSDGRGGLQIIRAGSGRTMVSLKRGQNILEASARLSHRDRFSQYIVKGQQPSWADQIPADQLAQVRGDATDPGARRHRPLLIIAEQSVDGASSQDRATWEANVRAARARQVTVVVQGWRERPDGALWSPNRLVRLADDWLAIDQDMLITGVTFSKGDQGTRTELSLMPPGAFELKAEPEPEEDAGWMQ